MLKSIKFLSASVGFILVTVFLFQFTFAYTCPDYLFSTDLAKGATNKDVRVMQEILNLDKRTLVAQTGPGSAGNETNFFGVATREALKRFQALFIEYIGIANGKFGPRTRTSMNAVCKGPFFTGGTGGVYDVGTTTIKDAIGPIVAIAGPLSATVGTPFRAYIGSNEAIKTPSLSAIIVTNATLGDIRKTSSTTFSFVVTPNEDAKDEITLQAEAGKIFDLAGNSNDDASNEWAIKINAAGTVDTNASYTLPYIDLPVVNGGGTPTPGSDCSTVTSVDINDYNNPCYGKAPMSNANAASSDSGGGGGGGMDPSQIMQMLSGLMKGLGGAGGLGSGSGQGSGQGQGQGQGQGNGQQNQGQPDSSEKGGPNQDQPNTEAAKTGGETDGSVGNKGLCDCVKLTTSFYSPIKGGSGIGAYIDVGVSGSGQYYVGRAAPATGICGEKLYTDPKICKKSCSGTCGGVGGTCCNPQLNNVKQPYMGILAPSDIGRYVNIGAGGP